MAIHTHSRADDASASASAVHRSILHTIRDNPFQADAAAAKASYRLDSNYGPPLLNCVYLSNATYVYVRTSLVVQVSNILKSYHIIPLTGV